MRTKVKVSSLKPSGFDHSVTPRRSTIRPCSSRDTSPSPSPTLGTADARGGRQKQQTDNGCSFHASFLPARVLLAPCLVVTSSATVCCASTRNQDRREGIDIHRAGIRRWPTASPRYPRSVRCPSGVRMSQFTILPSVEKTTAAQSGTVRATPTSDVAMHRGRHLISSFACSASPASISNSKWCASRNRGASSSAFSTCRRAASRSCCLFRFRARR